MWGTNTHALLLWYKLVSSLQKTIWHYLKKLFQICLCLYVYRINGSIFIQWNTIGQWKLMSNGRRHRVIKEYIQVYFSLYKYQNHAELINMLFRRKNMPKWWVKESKRKVQVSIMTTLSRWGGDGHTRYFKCYLNIYKSRHIGNHKILFFRS